MKYETTTALHGVFRIFVRLLRNKMQSVLTRCLAPLTTVVKSRLYITFRIKIRIEHLLKTEELLDVVFFIALCKLRQVKGKLDNSSFAANQVNPNNGT